MINHANNYQRNATLNWSPLVSLYSVRHQRKTINSQKYKEIENIFDNENFVAASIFSMNANIEECLPQLSLIPYLVEYL